MITESDMLMLHAAKTIKSYWSYKPKKGGIIQKQRQAKWGQ